MIKTKNKKLFKLCADNLMLMERNGKIRMFKDFVHPGTPGGDDSGSDFGAWFLLRILGMLKDSMSQIDDVMNNQEKREEKIYYFLVNKNSELANEAPQRDFFDMKYIYAIMVSNSEIGDGFVRISNALAAELGYTEEQLYAFACKNTPVILPFAYEEILNMPDLLNGLIEKDKVANVYVCSNKFGQHGAASIFYDGKIEEFSKEEPDNFVYIFPVSINESMVCFAKAKISKADLALMMKHSNAKTTKPEWFLTNTVLQYKKEEERIEKIV